MTASVPNGNARRDPRGDRAVEEEARDRPGAAEQADRAIRHRAHARQPRPADQVRSRAGPARSRRRRSPPRSRRARPTPPPSSISQELELHRRERGQPAAEAGAEQRPAVGGQRQPLLQPGRETAEQERADEVDGERRPRPLPAPRAGTPRRARGARARRRSRRRRPPPAPCGRSVSGRGVESKRTRWSSADQELRSSSSSAASSRSSACCRAGRARASQSSPRRVTSSA